MFLFMFVTNVTNVLSSDQHLNAGFLKIDNLFIQCFKIISSNMTPFSFMSMKH